MILAVDIGNTHIVLGLFEGDKLLDRLRLKSDPYKTEQEYELILRMYLEKQKIAPYELEGAILSSVVPSLKGTWRTALDELLGKSCWVVGENVQTHLEIDIDSSQKLGADLIVDAIAALAFYSPPLLIFDLGTATTYSYLDPQGVYRGGGICPGLRMSVDALASGTSSLPRIDLDHVDSVVARTTSSCMQAGALYGHAALLDGLLDRVEEEQGVQLTALATGGLISLVLPYCKKKIYPCPDLTLQGLRILYEINTQKNPNDKRTVSSAYPEYLIQGSRIFLKRWSGSVRPELNELFSSKENQYFYLPGSQKSYQNEALRELIQKWNDEEENFVYEIYLRDTQTWLGLAHIDAFDPELLCCEVGIALRSDFRRQGFAEETLELILSYLFLEKNFHKVLAKILSTNQASLALFSKLNFREEGCLHKQIPREGHYVDQKILALSQEVWKKGRNEEMNRR